MDPEVILDELEERMGPDGQVRQSEQMSFEELIPAEDASLAGFPTPRVSSPKPRKTSTIETIPVTGRHQDVRLYLTVLLKTYVEMTDSGLVRDLPYQVVAGPAQILKPDIVFVAHA